jgi:GTP cyclohydrolase I
MKTNFNSDIIDLHDQIGDEHILTSIETPMLPTAFDKTDAEKITERQGLKRRLFGMTLDKVNERLKQLQNQLLMRY